MNDEQKARICPVLSIASGDGNVACKGSDCQWWTGYGKVWDCAIVRLATALGFVSYSMKQQRGDE